jgi:molecular chaperone DnaK (HSP70)
LISVPYFSAFKKKLGFMAKFAIDLKSGDIKKETELIVGIDLGTTNSLVAYIKDGQAEAVKGKNGKMVPAPSSGQPLEDWAWSDDAEGGKESNAEDAPKNADKPKTLPKKKN